MDSKLKLVSALNRVEEQLKQLEEQGEEMEASSWGMQEGVLLSGNEAKLLAEFAEEALTARLLRKIVDNDRRQAEAVKEKNNRLLMKAAAQMVEDLQEFFKKVEK